MGRRRHHDVVHRLTRTTPTTATARKVITEMMGHIDAAERNKIVRRQRCAYFVLTGS